jgi:hypothetical protein
MRSGLPRLRTATFAIAVAFASWPAFAQTGPDWTTAWGTSQQVIGQTRVSNAKLRLIARVTVPGDAIRLRFDHTFGTTPVTFGKVSAGPRQSANYPASISPGLLMPVMFAGQSSVTTAAGGSVTSDPIALRVDAQEDIAVSARSNPGSTGRDRRRAGLPSFSPWRISRTLLGLTGPMLMVFPSRKVKN